MIYSAKVDIYTNPQSITDKPCHKDKISPRALKITRTLFTIFALPGDRCRNGFASSPYILSWMRRSRPRPLHSPQAKPNCDPPTTGNPPGNCVPFPPQEPLNLDLALLHKNGARDEEGLELGGSANYSVSSYSRWVLVVEFNPLAVPSEHEIGTRDERTRNVRSCPPRRMRRCHWVAWLLPWPGIGSDTRWCFLQFRQVTVGLEDLIAGWPFTFGGSGLRQLGYFCPRTIATLGSYLKFQV